MVLPAFTNTAFPIILSIYTTVKDLVWYSTGTVTGILFLKNLFRWNKIFNENFGPGTIFPENFGPALKKLFQA